jgi:hypothetical protein
MSEIANTFNGLWLTLQNHMAPGVAESINETSWLQLASVLVLCVLGNRAVTR